MTTTHQNARGDPTPVAQPPLTPSSSPIQVRGKFLFAGQEKFHARGVTYGPFKPTSEGCEYHDRNRVEADFTRMAALGINSVRTYTLPPRWLLDEAELHGLRVLAGLPWEQHVAFLHDTTAKAGVVRRLRASVRACAGHPALLGWAIGNEIPSAVVRWSGARQVETFLRRLYDVTKDEDPAALVTYVNYPSTEYLDLSFIDFVSFNVYLEAESSLNAYVARLQNIAGERPLVMGEIGLDSRRNGVDTQAATLNWQVRSLFAGGCAGVFVFAWTDEWHRGGCDIDDWDFGLTTRAGEAKPALDAVRAAFRESPFSLSPACPLISVIICSYNGSRTIADALQALERVTYPAFEVIVVDDGSTDNTAEIVRRHDVRLIQQANLGLSEARNTGWKAARGTVVAYLDDDAAPDPDWLHFLAHAFESGEFAGVGGPNVAFAEDGFVAQCVDHAPGNPTHVLISDREAEHLPGCNMAYRREWLAAVGGFDPMFRIAGDDVDLGWRIQQGGWKLGFHAGAMVWHHRRSSIRSYLKQQFNYGRAEGLLEEKWPEKYNAAGHLAWSGRLYDKSFARFLRSSRPRIYHGSWGSALFQHLYHPAPGRLRTLLIMPEWYLFMGLLAAIFSSGALPLPPGFGFGLWAIVFVLPAASALHAGQQMFFHRALRSKYGAWRLAAMTAFLHWAQPLARALGRLRQGLTPWRRHISGRMIIPHSRNVVLWSEKNWRSAEQRLAALEARMRDEGAVVARGGDWDGWDLEISAGTFAHARINLVTEEHGQGRQLVRIKIYPRIGQSTLALTLLLALLSSRAAIAQHWIAWAILTTITVAALVRIVYDCGSASAVALQAIPRSLGEGEEILESPRRA